MDSIRKWVLGLGFVKKDREEVYRKAFEHALQDLKETNKEDIDGKAEVLAKKMLNDTLSPVDLTQIVRFDSQKKLLYIGGRVADEQEVHNLRSEAQMIVATNLWKMIHETPKELAQRALFVDSQSMDDIVKGKSILYCLSTQQNIVSKFLR